MNISFHTGKSAMIAQGKALDIYGNNIANVNTVGYQTIRPDFADCIYETERRTEADWQTGHGTYIQKTDLMFSESFFNETDRPQDMAIAGEGFFAVQDRYGTVNYTRDGKFGITQENGTWYLVSSQGEYVLDYNKQRIAVPFDESGRNVDWDATRDEVGVFTFPNPYCIEALGSNRYIETARSGQATADRNMDKLGNALIASNVNLADQMVKLIETQRAYQLSSRVVTTSDELAQISNNLR